MQIYAHERGNSQGCTYFISFHEEELVIALVCEDNFFTYNKEEIESRIDNMMDLSASVKMALKNKLFTVSIVQRIILGQWKKAINH